MVEALYPREGIVMRSAIDKVRISFAAVAIGISLVAWLVKEGRK